VAEIVVALDHPTGDEALALLDRLPRARWVKVGSVLFTREGPALVETLRVRGLEVFLDLKWHDIPNTVAGAVRSAAALGAAMATLHTLGGREMMAAAREAAGSLRLVGVTVLTSHDAASFGQALGRDAVEIGTEALRLADEAMAAGLAGLVCSPAEVGALRGRLGKGALLVVPGIRAAGAPADDQRRTASAGEAAAAGATHLVVGRPITGAADPGAVLDRLVAEAGAGGR